MGELSGEIKYLKGVGPKRAELLEKELGLKTLEDLIHLYPFRYIDRTTIQKISQISQTSAYIQVKAEVVSCSLVGEGKAKRLSVMVDDGSGKMEMVFFKGLKWNQERLVPGRTFIFFGKPSEYNGRYNMVHPEVDDASSVTAGKAGVLTGVYPSTEKLKNAGITGKVMCRLQSAALALCIPEIQETLPDYVMHDLGLCTLPYALKNIHFPSDGYSLEKAQRRLKFE